MYFIIGKAPEHLIKMQIGNWVISLKESISPLWKILTLTDKTFVLWNMCVLCYITDLIEGLFLLFATESVRFASIKKKKNHRGLPWWFSGWDSELPRRGHRFNSWLEKFYIPCSMGGEGEDRSYIWSMGEGCFPGGSGLKNWSANGGDLGSIPGWKRFPGGGHGNPL